MPDGTSGPIESLLTDVWHAVRGIDTGTVADYIPELAKADPATFGLSLATLDGAVYTTGELVPFTIQSVSKPFVYAHAPAAGVSDEAPAGLEGVDVLIHDAQFLDHERPRAVDYGHATTDEALALARRTSAGSLVLFHHGPDRPDDALDQIGRDLGNDGYVRVAYQGLTLDIA